MKIIMVYFNIGYSGYKRGWERFDIIVRGLRERGCEIRVLGLKYCWKILCKNYLDIMKQLRSS
jgi:hypothetical protein